MRTRVKICRIGSAGEARTAAVAGADALGLALDGAPGSGAMDEATARTVERACPPGVSAFLLTTRLAGDEIAALARFVGAGVVQIVRHVEPQQHAVIRKAAPGLKIVQAVDMEDAQAAAYAQHYARSADALILEAGHAVSDSPEPVGAERRHDWALARRIVREVAVPVWLGGGVTPWNAAEAIEQVQPFGLDIAAGVRSGGRLDTGKLKSLFAAVKSAGGG